MNEAERVHLRTEMHKVFTPGFPINQHDFFRGRIPQLNKVLETVPNPGRHPIIFGQRGVGKTSFVNILTQFLLPGQTAVKVTCDGSDSFKSIWSRVFQKVSIEFKVHSFGFSRQESERKINLATFLGHEPGGSEPFNGITPADVANVMSLLKQRASFVIDEFDRISDDAAKKSMADLIKNVSDNNPNATLILVGVGESISDLIGEHPSIGRNLVQVEMPLMADGEIKEIVAKGLEFLKVQVEPEVLDQVAFLSAGFPHYAHLLGLSIVKACLIRDTKVVDLPVFEELACSLAVEDAVETYRNGFSKATKTVVPALQAFTDDERGAILDKVPFGTQNHYRFHEPMMRPFLRIKGRSFKDE